MMYNKCQNFQSIHLDNDCQAVFIPLSIVRLPEIQYLIPSSLDSHSSLFQQVGKLLWGTELYWIIVLQQKTYPELHVCLVVVLPLAQVTLQIRVPTLHGVANILSIVWCTDTICPSKVDTKEDNLPTSAMVHPATGPEVGLALPEGRGLFQHLYHTLKPPQ